MGDVVQLDLRHSFLWNAQLNTLVEGAQILRSEGCDGEGYIGHIYDVAYLISGE